MSQKLTMTGNILLSAVVRAIITAFPAIDTYKETVNQGAEYPYFMVYQEDFIEKKLMRKNYLQSFIISVLYQYKELPETSYVTSNDMAYKLTEILDTIKLPNGDKIRGYNKNYYPENQKLEFYINYDIKVAKELEVKPKQQKLKTNVYTKIKGE